MREDGVIVEECTKFQSVKKLMENHSMLCDDADLEIHFTLNETFTLFSNQKPNIQELEECNKVFITPDLSSWDP